jgi:serine/threonine-protein kinase
MRGAFVIVLVLGTALTSFTWSRVARSQVAASSAAAQALFDDARALMVKGNYAEACVKLEESQRLDPGSGTLLNLGDCYERVGRLASAWAMFLEAATAAQAVSKSDRVHIARERAAALEKRISRLTIRVSTDKIAGLEVRRDGSPLRPGLWGSAIPMDAGAHTVSATAPGRAAWQTTVTLRDGVSETVVIPDLPAAISTAARLGEPAKRNDIAPLAGEPVQAEGGAHGMGTQRVVALTTGGLGAAGVVVGTVFGLRSMSKRAESDKTCNGDSCADERGVNFQDEAIVAGNVSTVAFVVGAAGLATCAVLWFTTSPRATSARIGIGVGSVQINGDW